MNQVPTVGIDLAKKGLPGPQRGQLGQDPTEQAATMGSGRVIFRHSVRMSDWSGGLRQRSLLCPQDGVIRSYHEVDGAPIRQILRQNQQARRGGHQGDLKSGGSAEHAVCRDQDARAAKCAGDSSRPPGLC